MTILIKKRYQLADCFKLLAVFFYEPEMELWQQENILFRFCEAIQEIVPDAYPMAQRMCEVVEGSDEKQLKVDYATLFVGPFALPAAPYGSIYLEKIKRIMGDSTMVVLNLYREAGLKVDVKEVPDHIAIELEFMYFLYSEELEAVQSGDREKEISMATLRTYFLINCLAPWVHQFCQDIRNGTNNLFYINLAECLDLFIAEIVEADPITFKEQSRIAKENADQPVV
jgi:putative dimethyl sulfoxide reductase chaperone